MKIIDQNICEIFEKYELSIIEYNSMQFLSFYFLFANVMQIDNQQKVIAWIWYLRLNHCQLEMINQFRNKRNIEIIQSKTLKMIECIICVINKMHSLIQKTFISKIIKSYEIFHFDFIIYNKRFNDIICIIHFIDELISFNWVFSLNDHKKKTLIFVFKSLINQYDDVDMITNSIIKIYQFKNNWKIKFCNKTLNENNQSKIFRSKIKNQNVLRHCLLKKHVALIYMQNCLKSYILNFISLSCIWSTRFLFNQINEIRH